MGKTVFDKLKEYSGGKKLVDRKTLQELTGGLLTVSRLIKLDYTQTGIKNEKIGSKVYCDIGDVIEWLDENAELHGF